MVHIMRIICFLLSLIITFAYSEEVEIDGIKLGDKVANIGSLKGYSRGSVSLSSGKIDTYHSYLKQKASFGATDGIIGTIVKDYDNISIVDAINYTSRLEKKWGDINIETPFYKYIAGHKFWVGYIAPNSSDIDKIVIAYNNTSYKPETLTVQYILKSYVEYAREHDE